MVKKNLLVLIALLLMNPVYSADKAELGDMVLVEYTGKLDTGAVFDSNVGRSDLSFVLGEGKMLADFEQAFVGMKEGETKTIKIPAARAYGEFDERQVVHTSLDKLPKGAKVGDELTLRTSQGYYPVRVVLIDEEIAFIDGNHKLAGQDLTFEIKLKEVIKQDS